MRTLLLAGLALCSPWLPGCSGPQAEVSGTVRLNGSPIKEGAINFIPTGGNHGPSAGAIIRDGKYHIPRSKGATVGKNLVELRAFLDTGRQVQDPTGPRGTLVKERIMAFPPEYNDRSTLVREVQLGSNTFDFDIQTTGK
jgi:hypothetical protein